MVSHPETGSDSPIGSDRDRGRDKFNPKDQSDRCENLSNLCITPQYLMESMWDHIINRVATWVGWVRLRVIRAIVG